MSQEATERANKIIIEFEKTVRELVDRNRIKSRFIRPLIPGSVVCGLLNDTYFVGYNAHLGLPTQIFTNLQGNPQAGLPAYNDFLRDSFGISFCVVALRDEWLDAPDRDSILRSVAMDVIQRELSEHQNESSIMSSISVFGPNHFPVQNEMVFILMPFDDELTRIYQHFVKKVVENKGMVCRRADDLNTNNAIIYDIWKSICESRFIIADISTLNANVMYELGIAHAIGKETILIHQEGTSPKFPFDLSHIRILNYENTAIGGTEFQLRLDAAIDSVLQKLDASDLRAS